MVAAMAKLQRRGVKRVEIDGVEYGLGLVPMKDFDPLWAVVLEVIAAIVDAAKGADLSSGTVKLTDLDLGAVSDALQKAKRNFGWGFVYGELGGLVAKHCTVTRGEIEERLDAVYDEHFDEKRAFHFMRWLAEAVRHNTGDFFDGLGSILGGPGTPDPSP